MARRCSKRCSLQLRSSRPTSTRSRSQLHQAGLPPRTRCSLTTRAPVSALSRRTRARQASVCARACQRKRRSVRARERGHQPRRKRYFPTNDILCISPCMYVQLARFGVCRMTRQAAATWTARPPTRTVETASWLQPTRCLQNCPLQARSRRPMTPTATRATWRTPKAVR